MGWTFTRGQTRKELITRLTMQEIGQEYSWFTLKQCTRGNILWTISERLNMKTGERDQAILCFLMQYDRNCGGWGYKDMCEAAHPYYYSCPLSYLDEVPVVSKAWRLGVKVYHAEKKVVGAIKRELKKGAISRNDAIGYLAAVTGRNWA